MPVCPRHIQGHIDLKYPQETVGHIFQPCRRPSGSPRHPFRNAEIHWSRITIKQPYINASNGCDLILRVFSVPNSFPSGVIELDFRRGNKVLQCPSHRKPFALLEARVSQYRPAFHIGQIRIANSRFFILSIHRIDYFGQFGAARFVDAAAIHPSILQTVLKSLVTAQLNLGVAFLPGCHAILHVLERDLVISPSVREDFIFRIAIIEEFFKF